MSQNEPEIIRPTLRSFQKLRRAAVVLTLPVVDESEARPVLVPMPNQLLRLKTRSKFLSTADFSSFAGMLCPRTC